MSPRALAVTCVALFAGIGAGCIGPGSPGRTDASAEAGPAASAGSGGARTLHDASLAAVPDAAVDPVALAEKGKTLYGKYCNFCHGDEGQGYKADEAPVLASDDLLPIASDEYLKHAVLRGRPGTTMSAWAVARGGPLGVTEAGAIVAYLRTWQKKPSEAATVDARVVTGGDAKRGAPLYAAKCQSCHGAQGRGGKYNALANPELLASAKDGFLATSIERGRAGSPMPAFAGKLDATQIADLVALLRSWQKPPEEFIDLPPKPGELKNIVINPKGAQPAFDPKADFIKVDDVKKAIDRGETMIIADARASGDYAQMHVAGAISVPFYQVADYAKQIPKDRWILTYCACPHAASVKLRDALRGLGYTKVAVLDEGILAWRDRGYPVRGGSTKP